MVQVNFHQKKLREIVLSRNADGRFELAFWFDIESSDPLAQSQQAAAAPHGVPRGSPANGAALPTYVMVEETGI